MSYQREAIIELHRAGKTNSEIVSFSTFLDSLLMDFSVWSILEADACASSHGSVDALKCSLEKAWAKIPQESLCNAAKSFRKRLELVIQAKGGYIE